MQRVTEGPGDAAPIGDLATAPVFLIGPARSGTSLLYKVLCLHPEAAYISNWVARYPRSARAATLNRLAGAMPSARRRAWFGDGSNAYVYGEKRPLRRRLFPMPVEGEPVYAACGVPQGEELAPEGLWQEGQALRRSVSSIRSASGGSVFINKRIANNLRIPFLAGAFPDARFVSLVRDGRAVALSLSKVDWWPDSHVWWFGGTPRQWEEQGGDPWELCARNWVEELAAIERGLALIPSEQVLHVKYEMFVDQPIETLASIAGFAGLPDEARWREAVSELGFPDRNEAWRTALDADAIDLITRIQAERLEAYGYDG
ncbi:MAG: sulfotransferase family protein [Actinomycetota bacterium]